MERWQRAVSAAVPALRAVTACFVYDALVYMPLMPRYVEARYERRAYPVCTLAMADTRLRLRAALPAGGVESAS